MIWLFMLTLVTLPLPRQAVNIPRYAVCYLEVKEKEDYYATSSCFGFRGTDSLILAEEL